MKTISPKTQRREDAKKGEWRVDDVQIPIIFEDKGDNPKAA
jgi:hypothetical protein